MEEEKHDLCSTEEKKTRKRKQCLIPDAYRCQRSDQKKHWQCKNARVDHIYCQHHIDLTTRNYLARRERRKQHPTKPCEKQPKEDKKFIPMEDRMAFAIQVDTSQPVGTSKRAMNNMCRIRIPETAQERTVPSDISDLKELLPAIMMEAWNRELTPAERDSLRKDDSNVRSICGAKVFVKEKKVQMQYIKRNGN